MTSKVPDNVRELLTRVDSFEKLEIVLFLHRADRGTSTLDELARVLGLTRSALQEATRELRAVSLVNVSTAGVVQLLPPSSRDRVAVDALAKAYEEDRFGIVKELSDIAMGHIRNMAANVFADAFVIRKKPPKDGNDG